MISTGDARVGARTSNTGNANTQYKTNNGDQDLQSVNSKIYRSVRNRKSNCSWWAAIVGRTPLSMRINMINAEPLRGWGMQCMQ